MRISDPLQPHPASLEALRERLAAIEHVGRKNSTAIATDWPEIDCALGIGGLGRSAVHEWFGLGDAKSSHRWTPALAVLVHLVRQSVTTFSSPETLHVCWIGKRIWPNARTLSSALLPTGNVLARSLFVDVPDTLARLWAVDIAARSGSAVVVADGSGFDMAGTRRLQLACEASSHPVLLARPAKELGELSAAFTRFRVERVVSCSEEPSFRVSMLRSKGVGSLIAPDRTFILASQSNGRVVSIPSQLRRGHVASSLAG